MIARLVSNVGVLIGILLAVYGIGAQDAGLTLMGAIVGAAYRLLPNHPEGDEDDHPVESRKGRRGP